MNETLPQRSPAAQPAPSGPLPGFLILGAPKAGTTTLAAWWDQHPQGYTAPEKEVEFYSSHYDRGLDWYAGRFAGAQPGQIGCDGSPHYLYDDASLDRIAATLPEVRLLVVLREPVARAWSHWCYNVTLGIEPRPFRTVLRQELRDESVTPPNFPFGYLTGSRYLPRLRAIGERFDREQLLVLFTDELKQEPAQAWAKVCRHVGVEEVEPPAGDVRNAGRTARSHRLQRLVRMARNAGVPSRITMPVALWNLTERQAPLDPAHRRLMAERLHPELPALATWLGRDLPATWSTPAS